MLCFGFHTRTFDRIQKADDIRIIFRGDDRCNDQFSDLTHSMMYTFVYEFEFIVRLTVLRI